MSPQGLRGSYSVAILRSLPGTPDPLLYVQRHLIIRRIVTGDPIAPTVPVKHARLL